MAFWVARSRVCSRDEAFSALFHSSAPVSWSRKSRRSSDNLTPSSSASSSVGSIHVASTESRAKPPPFARDAVPHADIGEHSPQPSHVRNPSFRRRSEVRNKQDWERRTGRWSTSSFGGGYDRGSRKGLQEDRSSSYGLNSRRLDAPQRGKSNFQGGSASSFEYARPRSETRPTRPSPFGKSNAFQGRSASSFEYARPRSETRPTRPSPFGLRPMGATQERTLQPQSFARGRPENESGNFRNTSKTEDHFDEALRISPLKNRNQPSVSSSPPPSAAVKTPPAVQKPPGPAPSKKESVVASLFYNPPVVLARAGVPIVSKSDPSTASTTSSYSPSMALKNDLPTKFTSPPLLPGLLKCLTDLLGGPAAVPSPIQASSLKWILEPWTAGQENGPTSDSTEVSLGTKTREKSYKEYLLASETGSGKSIAYLLPVLQALKLSEVRRATEGLTSTSKRGLNPRALILAPTHELARQISAVAKALLHDVKLRVLCASRANIAARPPRDPIVAGKGKKNSNTSRMKALLSSAEDGAMGEFQLKETDVGNHAFSIDVVVGTPMKLMEMIRGRGWEKSVEFSGGAAAAFEREKQERAEKTGNKDEEDADDKGPKRRRGRDSLPGVGKWRSSPEMGLSEVEWVIVDEADVLFDPDFQETTRLLLADISKARGHDVPFTALPVGLLAPIKPAPTPVPASSRQKEKDNKAKAAEQTQNKQITLHRGSAIAPVNYPFNFLLTSATIPNSLSTYLNAYHPALQRFISPNLHHFPKTLKPEYVNWTGGNKNSDIERRLRKVWAADAAEGLGPVPGSLGDMSKVIIFCNRNTKVNDLGDFLEEKGIKNIQLSSSSENRKRGSNKHLDGFLKATTREMKKDLDDWSASSMEYEKVEPKRSLVPKSKAPSEPINDPMHVPHVMITTSLLSRGLDFSPNVKHVFIVDEPRNMIDFLHRAGRTGRAGSFGKVVIFGKMEGRGSQRSKEVRKRIKSVL